MVSSTVSRLLLKVAMTTLLWRFSLTVTQGEVNPASSTTSPLPPPSSTIPPSSSTPSPLPAPTPTLTPTPPPSPSTQNYPTWGRGRADRDKPTTDTDGGEKGGPFTNWPWWWWMVGAAIIVVIVSLNVLVCACLCCRRKRRKRRREPKVAVEGDTVEIDTPPTDFRRMESSAAKRYLHNIVSVFSWGSDFEADNPNPSPPSASAIYANTALCVTPASASTDENVYANTHTLGIHARDPARR